MKAAQKFLELLDVDRYHVREQSRKTNLQHQEVFTTARGKGRANPRLNQSRKAVKKNGNTAARPVGHF